LLGVVPGLCFGQDFVIDNLTNNRWTSRVIVTDFNIGGFKEIGLSKLKAPINSIKNDVSIWEFGNQEVKIVSYRNGQGLDSLIIKCTYDYDKNKRAIRIFHFSQDSRFWDYSLGIVSTGNYLLLTRKN
jgi:hypothetical protein